MDDIVENILKERYYQPGETCWEDIARRVSNALFEEGTSDNELCYQYLNDKVFIFNSPALMNAGTEIGQLSACFVLPIKDDMSDIYDTIRKSALIFQSGGGVGINWSTLRPEGAPVGTYNTVSPIKKDYGEEHFSNFTYHKPHNVGIKTASGPIAFMKSFDSMVETVKSAGSRRGAAIAILNCDHPDIFKFIKIKNEEGVLPNFNISVMLTNAFMTAVEQDNFWDLVFEDKKYDTVRARELFNEICRSAWTRAEPGVLFFDTINKDNPMKNELGAITTVNPCSEQPLCVDYETGGGEACVLGSIDVSRFVDNHGIVNCTELTNVVRFAVRALDRIVDVNKYPLPEIRDCVMKGRKIGLGVMGFADSLIKRELSYGSIYSLKFINELMSHIQKIADDESIKIGNGKKKNACTLTVAPTGSLALFANCSSGIEPNFGWVYNRSTWVDGEKKTYRMVHPLFRQEYKDYARYENILEYVEKNGTLKGCPDVLPTDCEVFCVAKDIPPEDHIDVQAEFQKYVDASISKTINCPNSTTIEDIYNIYMHAWKSGCKGLTIYREGSRQDVVLETNASKQLEKAEVIEIKNPVQYKLLVNPTGRILAKTPREIPSITYKRSTGCGKMMITIGEVNGKPHTIVIKNKGGCDAMTQAVAELTSLCERYEVPQWNTNKVLMGIRCPAAMKNPKSDGKSCAEILGKILNDFYPHEDEPPKDDEEPPKATPPIVTIEYIDSTNVCPDCGEPLTHEGGCVICKNCAYSRCG